MKVVTNTGPLIKLTEIGRLNLLTKLYDKLYAPVCVKRELLYPDAAVKFLANHVDVREVVPSAELIDALGLEGCDIEVYLLYRDVVADEMLFANRDAKRKLGNYGKTRDVIELKNLAEEMGLFSREDSKTFLLDLKRIQYMPHDVDKELRKYL